MAKANGQKRPVTIPTDQAILGYVAGLIDGEGTIAITSVAAKGSVNRSHGLKIVMSNCDETLIAWWMETIGGSLTIKPGTATARRMFRIEIYGRVAANLVAALQPFLISRRAQAIIALEFSALIRPRRIGRRLDPAVVADRERLKQRMHIVNVRGPLRNTG
jgi:hypothetical protein